MLVWLIDMTLQQKALKKISVGMCQRLTGVGLILEKKRFLDVSFTSLSVNPP